MKSTISTEKASRFFADKLEFTTGPVELYEMIRQKQNINIIDVRISEHYAMAHIPGAVNLPKEKWDTCHGLSKTSTNVVYCYSEVCHLAAAAAKIFADRGYPVIELEGGFDAWSAYDLPAEA